MISDLLNLKIFTPEELIRAINAISKSLNLDTTLQTAVDIMFDLYPNYNGGVILLIDDNQPDRLYSQTVSNMPRIEKVHELLGKPLSQFYINIKSDQNLLAKAVRVGQNFTSNVLSDFATGSVNDKLANLVGTILNFKVGIAIPMKFDNKIIGAILYTKRIKEEFSIEEQRVLELLTQQIAITIYNAKLFSEINKDLDNLKAKIGDLVYS